MPTQTSSPILAKIRAFRMAEPKANLIKRDRYAVRQAAVLAASLIKAHELDIAGPWKLVLEASDENGWDDAVAFYGCELATHVKEGWQIKRQTTDMPENKFKDIILSAVDLLATRSTSTRRLCLGFHTLVSVVLPKTTNRSKSKLQLIALQELCSDARKPGISAGRVRPSTGNGALWHDTLAAWLSGDTGLVFEVLKHLEIRALGDEAQLDRDGAALLEPLFRGAAGLFQQILEFLSGATDPRLELTYAVLSEQLLQQVSRQHGRGTWWRAARDGSFDLWRHCGTTPSTDIVSHAWATAAGCSVALHLDATPSRRDDALERSLLRLAAHRCASSHLHASEHSKWEAHLALRTCGTLGFDATTESELRLCEMNADKTGAAGLAAAGEALANGLNDRMNAHCWDSVQQTIREALADPVAHSFPEIESALLTQMADLWNAWTDRLNADQSERQQFLIRLLATAEELRCTDFDHHIRLGPKSIRRITSAVLLALAVGVVFKESAPRAAGQASNIHLGDVPVHVLALTHVSTRQVRRGLPIDDAVHAFVDDEESSLILPNTSASATHLHRVLVQGSVPFTSDCSHRDGFHSTFARKPIITLEPGLRNALRSGATAVRNFLLTLLKDLSQRERADLQAAIEET